MTHQTTTEVAQLAPPTNGADNIDPEVGHGRTHGHGNSQVLLVQQVRHGVPAPIDLPVSNRAGGKAGGLRGGDRDP